jgi:hypothetical protein
MRWWVVALCAGILMSADGCRSISSPADRGQGQLLFQKDSVSCADTTNTELYIDGVSQGQFTLRPGSIVGFTEPAGTHIVDATERAGLLRKFPTQAVVIPTGGTASYVMTCGSKPPPAAPPSSSPPDR